jgi:hypothetical protein
MLLQSLTFHINYSGDQEVERKRMWHQPARNEQDTSIIYARHHVHTAPVSPAFWYSPLVLFFF